MAYNIPHNSMKDILFSMSLLAMISFCFISCSKDEGENSSPYTPEQLTTLKVLHGSFSNTPNLMTGNIKTTFTFNETFLDKPRTVIATNIYEEKSERTIHGYLTYRYDYGDGSSSDFQHAFHIDTKGTDMTLYSINTDKTISLRRSPEIYKNIIKDDNHIRIVDPDYPVSPGQDYYRN